MTKFSQNLEDTTLYTFTKNCYIIYLKAILIFFVLPSLFVVLMVASSQKMVKMSCRWPLMYEGTIGKMADTTKRAFDSTTTSPLVYVQHVCLCMCVWGGDMPVCVCKYIYDTI